MSIIGLQDVGLLRTTMDSLRDSVSKQALTGLAARKHQTLVGISESSNTEEADSSSNELAARRLQHHR